ncbi:DUF3261 domain-containing protein [Salinicola acroporae]|uniref:DUF3261 domain-containing protein n=1 Tax=Salinicola acroporae TaxID=1541440 RepID=A0ABT6I3C1_9GAMM|nr:DUF3261 domain-containing protein [Salinicola acroporae]MDH4572183.1 DUF3261 domain-containing protein [Salinicola acroporae]
MRRVFPLLPLCLAFALSACSLSPPVSPPPPLAAATTTDTLKSRLTFEPDEGEARTLIAFIRIEPERLRAVLVTPYGQRLTTLVRDADGARFEAGDAPGEPPLPIPPEWLASRLEWSLWPLDALHEAFAGSAWQVVDGAASRDITYRGRLIARITPVPARDRAETMMLDDRQGHYRLTIAPMQENDDS